MATSTIEKSRKIRFDSPLISSSYPPLSMILMFPCFLHLVFSPFISPLSTFSFSYLGCLQQGALLSPQGNSLIHHYHISYFINLSQWLCVNISTNSWEETWWRYKIDLWMWCARRMRNSWQIKTVSESRRGCFRTKSSQADCFCKPETKNGLF